MLEIPLPFAVLEEDKLNLKTKKYSLSSVFYQYLPYSLSNSDLGKTAGSNISWITQFSS